MNQLILLRTEHFMSTLLGMKLIKVFIKGHKSVHKKKSSLCLRKIKGGRWRLF